MYYPILLKTSRRAILGATFCVGGAWAASNAPAGVAAGDQALLVLRTGQHRGRRYPPVEARANSSDSSTKL